MSGMSDKLFSVELRNLINQYNKRYISFEDYRSQREVLLDRIDEEYNEVDFNKTQPRNVPKLDRSDN